MGIRQVVGSARRNGVRHLTILVANRLKEALAPHVGVRVWARYNRLKVGLLFGRRSVADPFSLLWVAPESVQYRAYHGTFRPSVNLGNVCGGRWDRPERPLVGHNIHEGLRERFVEGYDWADTAYFAYNAPFIRAGRPKKGCSTVEEFLEVRCRYLDTLYDSIRTGGYRTQVDLGGELIDENKLRGRYYLLEANEVGVNVGRDGTLFLNTGNHRLAMAKALGLESIPVQVIVRHPGWQRLRAEVAAADTVDGLSVRAREALEHPDMADVAASLLGTFETGRSVASPSVAA